MSQVSTSSLLGATLDQVNEIPDGVAELSGSFALSKSSSGSKKCCKGNRDLEPSEPNEICESSKSAPLSFTETYPMKTDSSPSY